MRRPPIASNIPEGTLWPDLDDGRRVRLEQCVALVDETYGRSFASLKDADTPPDLSAAGQWRSYERIRRGVSVRHMPC